MNVLEVSEAQSPTPSLGWGRLWRLLHRPRNSVTQLFLRHWIMLGLIVQKSHLYS